MPAVTVQGSLKIPYGATATSHKTVGKCCGRPGKSGHTQQAAWPGFSAVGPYTSQTSSSK